MIATDLPCRLETDLNIPAFSLAAYRAHWTHVR